MRSFLIFTLLALPVGAYTTEELLRGRDGVFNCPDTGDVCTIKKKDVEWVVSRDFVLNKLLEEAAKQYQRCGGRNL